MKASTSAIVYANSDTESLVCQDRQGIVKLYGLEKSGYVMKSEVETNHSGFARAMKISSSKNLLLTPFGNSEISIFDLQNSTIVPIHQLSFSSSTEKPGQIMCMKDLCLTTETSPYLIVGYECGLLVLWDLKEFKAVHHIKYDFPVCSVDYDASTNRGVLSSPTIHKIHIFGIDRNKIELIQRDGENIELQHSDSSKKVAGVSSLKIRTDKKCLFVGLCDGVVNIFSWKSLRKLATLRNHRSEITDIAFSSSPIDSFKSNLSAIASTDGSVSLWDIYYK